MTRRGFWRKLPDDTMARNELSLEGRVCEFPVSVGRGDNLLCLVKEPLTTDGWPLGVIVNVKGLLWDTLQEANSKRLPRKNDNVLALEKKLVEKGFAMVYVSPTGYLNMPNEPLLVDKFITDLCYVSQSLQDHFGMPPVFMGHSLGAYFAMRAALVRQAPVSVLAPVFAPSTAGERLPRSSKLVLGVTNAITHLIYHGVSNGTANALTEFRKGELTRSIGSTRLKDGYGQVMLEDLRAAPPLNSFEFGSLPVLIIDPKNDILRHLAPRQVKKLSLGTDVSVLSIPMGHLFRDGPLTKIRQWPLMRGVGGPVQDYASVMANAVSAHFMAAQEKRLQAGQAVSYR